MSRPLKLELFDIVLISVQRLILKTPQKKEAPHLYPAECINTMFHNRDHKRKLSLTLDHVT